MKSQKMRPLSTKLSEESPNKPWKKWFLALILATLFIGYLIWKGALSDTSASLPVTKQIEATESIPTQLDSVTSDSDNTDASVLSNNQSLDLDAVLSAPLPKTDSLAKEESDRLDDETNRLIEQEKLLAEQLAMNKQLADMKAEQITLVEQQIAQLEADGTVKTEVK
ncbi:hypothetical protein I6E61_00835 [Psychrobacter sp. NZS113]|uniref:hypothetical protein n=1 Tax=Psychrobacter sp. NZS113 TaxID=2792045 RepID=UPI0018CD5A41|nr:hypothetical protein [Psychrobacter sp. NZS113]MBH0094932.1 hypothetical protein [Psychrobacter sp. NZS113]